MFAMAFYLAERGLLPSHLALSRRAFEKLDGSSPPAPGEADP